MCAFALAPRLTFERWFPWWLQKSGTAPAPWLIYAHRLSLDLEPQCLNFLCREPPKLL